jgi:protein arginine N-methyltransferase 1
MTSFDAAPRLVDEPAVELWPSLGEYPVYDAFVYHLMSHDEGRNTPYRQALCSVAAGKVVVDVGTGSDLLWARAALDAGARRVFAIESLPDAAARAADLARSLGLDSAITVLEGYAEDVTLPEPADICVVEMVGSIGSAEGVDRVAFDAYQRLVRPGGLVLPGSIVTHACGVTLPDEIAGQPGFTVVAADYIEQVWDAAGAPFDIRLAVRGIEPSHALTASVAIESLELGAPATDVASAEVRLTAERAGRLDGLLAWTKVQPVPGGPTIETFPTTGSGLPVFVPLFHPGVEVAAGTAIGVVFDRRPGADDFHPDYRFTAAVDGSSSAVVLPWAGGVLAQSPFYKALWSG